MKKFLSVFILVTAAIASAFAATHIPDFFEHAKTVGLSLAAMPLLLDGSQARIAYERVVQLASTNNFIVSPGHIRSEKLVTNSDTTYSFDVRDTTMQGTISTRPLQKGVLDNDLFIAFRQGIFIDHRTALQSDVILQTYPNSAHFVASTAAYDDLWAIYNGLLSVQVGSTEFINQFQTNAFATVPDTQKSLAANESGYDLFKACKDLGTYSIYSGKGDNKVQLNIKTFSGYAAAPASGENVITYMAYGFIVRNGANAFEDFRKALNPKSGANG
jgi:hypothetical protein